MRWTAVVSIVVLVFLQGSAGCTTGNSGSGRRFGSGPATGGHPDGGTGGTPPSPEVCNGTDDDRDGSVDEGCACAAGATQACWPGDPAQRGRGVCRDGNQTCEMTSVEFAAWGPCEGALLPGAEIPGNCIDEDCDGDSPGCGEPCGEFETCGNGRDDDCDGLVDCDDDACSCVDCVRNPELCTCYERCVPGTQRYCDEPMYCAWGLQDCGPDGRWGACIETNRIPPECVEEPPFPTPFPLPTTYDPGCCVRAGHCCQNYGHDPSLDIDASIGNCTGRVERVCAPR